MKLPNESLPNFVNYLPTYVFFYSPPTQRIVVLETNLKTMKRESMEEGLIKKHITNNDTKINGQDDITGSSVTPLLLFSTFVAISASFTFGCAVSFS